MARSIDEMKRPQAGKAPFRRYSADRRHGLVRQPICTFMPVWDIEDEVAHALVQSDDLHGVPS